MTVLINTVLGAIPSDRLGKTLIHEHFVFGYPGFQKYSGEKEFPWADALKHGIAMAERMQARGVQTVVDPTPNECGRNPQLLKEIAESTGLQIICATGYYSESKHSPEIYKLNQGSTQTEDAIYELFRQELRDGIGQTGIKAGVIKLASSKGLITDYETMFFRAAAKVQQETGAIIITHTEGGTMGAEQAELLQSNGADPHRVVIGHMCGNTNVRDHIRLLKAGFFTAFDRFGLDGVNGGSSDAERLAILIGLTGIGLADQILLSQDTVNYWLGRTTIKPGTPQKDRPNWYPTYLFDNIIAILKNVGMSEAQIESFFVENPQRLFGAL